MCRGGYSPALIPDRSQATELRPASITGGTGAYAGARGEMTFTEDPKHKRNVITVTLLP